MSSGGSAPDDHLAAAPLGKGSGYPPLVDVGRSAQPACRRHNGNGPGSVKIRLAPDHWCVAHNAIFPKTP